MKKSELLGNKIINDIIFYCSSINEQKKDLLKSLDVKVQIDELSDSDAKYIDYYKKLIRRFQHKF